MELVVPTRSQAIKQAVILPCDKCSTIESKGSFEMLQKEKLIL